MSDSSMSIGDRQACFGPPPEPDDPDLQCKTSDAPDPARDGERDPVCGPAGGHPPDEQGSVLDSRPSYDPAKVGTMVKNQADYETISVSASLPFLPTVGVSASYTVDRFGHQYFGLG